VFGRLWWWWWGEIGVEKQVEGQQSQIEGNVQTWFQYKGLWGEGLIE
jgi:hypothetical protein